MKKVLAGLLATIAIVVMAGCSAPVFGGKTAGPNRACIDKVVASYKTLQSSGLWECMSPRLRAAEFDANGWQSDKDVNNWLQNVKVEGVTVAVVEYKDNPLADTDGNGNVIAYEYHFRLIPSNDPTLTADPTSIFAFSLVVTIDTTGQIVSIA